MNLGKLVFCWFTVDCWHILTCKINLKLLPLSVYHLDDHIKGVKWVSHVICVEEKRNAYRVLVGKLKVRKRPPGRPRHRWENSIKLDLKEIAWEGMAWTNLAQGRDQGHSLVRIVMNLCVQSGEFLERLSNYYCFKEGLFSNELFNSKWIHLGTILDKGVRAIENSYHKHWGWLPIGTPAVASARLQCLWWLFLASCAPLGRIIFKWVSFEHLSLLIFALWEVLNSFCVEQYVSPICVTFLYSSWTCLFCLLLFLDTDWNYFKWLLHIYSYYDCSWFCLCVIFMFFIL